MGDDLQGFEEEPVERDPSVTDMVWAQLQADKAAAMEEQE